MYLWPAGMVPNALQITSPNRCRCFEGGARTGKCSQGEQAPLIAASGQHFSLKRSYSIRPLGDPSLSLELKYNT